LLVDSDAFIVFGASGLVREASEVLGVDLRDLRRLHPLPNMLDRGKLAAKYPPAIREKVKSWCAVVAPITEAPRLDTRQRLLGVQGIHDGESDLFGLLHENPGYLLLSNDKTAMRALRSDASLKSVYESLCGRVACAESVLMALLPKVGVETLATALAPLRPHNGMLNAIFSMGASTSFEHCVAGLSSYLGEMTRDLGPNFLLKL
jgi:hypothetical protein